MKFLRGLRAPGAAVATTIGVLAGIALFAGRQPFLLYFVVFVLVVVVTMYGLARLAARLPFRQPTPRHPVVGVAVAMLCLVVAAACGSRLWANRELLAIGILSLAVALYTERDARPWRETARIWAPSALTVVGIGGCNVLRVVTATAWMWDPSSTTGAPWAGIRFLIDCLARDIAVPLGWSYAVCHVVAARWPAFQTAGRRGILLRALPGVVLVSTPMVVFALTFVRPQPIGQLVPVTQTPVLLAHSAYLVAALVILLARVPRTDSAVAGAARV